MKLSDLCKKSVYTNTTFQGVCRGVGLSLKSHAVRYLLCASTPTQTSTDFSVGVNAVAEIGERIQLSRLRPASPKGCAKIAIGLPVYAFDGGYLGKVADLDLHDFTATTLYTDRGERFPILSVFACSDAVILRKEQPYPIGQRIPAPLLYEFLTEKDVLITKSILKKAIEKGSLIKLTLSLAPFKNS